MRKAEELLCALKVRATQEPPEGSRTLSICGVDCGVLVPRVYEVLRSPAFYDVFEETSTGLELPYAGETAAQRLATLAKTLFDSGMIFQWRNELLDVVSFDLSQKLTKAERGIFRFLGLTTTCVHAVARDDTGLFWLGKRSATKQVDPSLWDTLSGGLSSAGETLLETLARETVEEAGVEPSCYTVHAPAEFLVTRPVREGWMRERTVVYPITLNKGTIPKNQDGEVERFEAITKEELLGRIATDSLTLDAAIGLLKTLES